MSSAYSSASNGARSPSEEAGTIAVSEEEAAASGLLTKYITEVLLNFFLDSSLSSNFLLAVSVPVLLLSSVASSMTFWTSTFVFFHFLFSC